MRKFRSARGGESERRNKGGSHLCAVCNSPHQDEINEALIARVHLRSLAARYGMSPASLSRHRSNHISKALVAIPARSTVGEPLLERYESMIAQTEPLAWEAHRKGQMALFLKLAAQLRELYTAVAKLTGELDERPVVSVNIQTNPEWQQVYNVICEVLEPYPDLRFAIDTDLLALDRKRMGFDPKPESE